MLALNNVTYRSTITEADYFMAHITSNKADDKITQNEITLPGFS